MCAHGSMDVFSMIDEFIQSGELQLMQKLSSLHFDTIFDVGANIGEWTDMVIETQPTSQYHCFEPVPSTARDLRKISGPNVTINPYGLSDETGWKILKYTPDNTKLTTACTELNRDNSYFMHCLMVDGYSYCQNNRIKGIDFLKIDTEGHEMKVLDGFYLDYSSSVDISMIQFEYGYANVLSKDLLIDFYRLLSSDYEIGKLTPNGVEFKEYNLIDEDFKGPNYIAVHKKFPDVVELIRA